MLAAQAKERRRIASKMPADGIIAAAPPRRYRHIPLQGQPARLYNLSRPFEGVSLSSMGLRRLSASWKTEFHLRNFVRAARGCGRDGWPVIAIAWLGVRRVHR